MTKRFTLFKKYVLIFGTLTGCSLLLSGLLSINLSYQENKQAVIRLQREKAEAAAARIGQYLFDIEQRISVITASKQGVSALDQRCQDIQFLRNVAAVSEVYLLDSQGREYFRVSRHAVDVSRSGQDFSTSDVFRLPKTGQLYRSPIYFRDGAPFMTVSMAVGPEEAGITVVEVYLEFLLDGITRIKVGSSGHAYAVDATGLLIAHPDIGLVFKKTSLAALPQVQAAIKNPAYNNYDRVQAHSLDGKPVLTAFGTIPQLGWFVFVEEPLAEAYRPLYSQATHSALLVFTGMLFTLFVCLFVVHRLMRPIHSLQDGARLIGRGVLEHHITVATGDELEELANEFNQMAAQLRISYATLESKVVERTNELLHAQKATEESNMALRLQRDLLQEEITERRQAEEALLESEEKFRSIVESSPLAMYFYHLNQDGDLILTGANPSADRIIGVSHRELLGKRIEDVFPNLRETDIPEMYRKVAKGELGQQSFEITYTDDLVKGIYSVHVYRTGPEMIAVDFLDITDRKRVEEEHANLEKQLLHAQKLESLGVLAGGIAHDFNNILMAIIGNADLALMRMNPESPAIDNIRMIEQAAARAADLAKQMLAYSGKGKFVVESLNLNILLEEMLHMLEVSISKKAVLRLNQIQHLPSVEADATQIRQIIMNLVINASEAIGDKSGVIAITTGCMDCDRNYLKDVWLDENLTDGLYVYLEIADSGCGMDKETLSKIFDPFFTTKFTGRGLGMSAVLGIVRGHKGAIKVYSEPTKGTTFKILLPASNKPSELFNGELLHDDWHGSGTVLLVDDEETVRGVGKAMLHEFGFTTITANDGREAVELFRQDPDFAFVILDLTMPHMDGEQCFRELRQIKPDVKVIISSGFSEHEVAQKFAGKGLAGFVQKPYKLSVLKKAIKGII